MSNLAIAFGILDPLQKRVTDGLPVYGSCAGMIMLADKILDGRPDQRTIGGIDMVVRRNAFGRQVDSFEGDVAFEDLGDKPVHGVFIRAPWVETIGDAVDGNKTKTSKSNVKTGSAQKSIAMAPPTA